MSSKRICPFEGDLTPQMKMHVGLKEAADNDERNQEMKKIYERTLQLLRNGPLKLAGKNVDNHQNRSKGPGYHFEPPRLKQMVMNDKLELEHSKKIILDISATKRDGAILHRILSCRLLAVALEILYKTVLGQEVRLRTKFQREIFFGVKDLMKKFDKMLQYVDIVEKQTCSSCGELRVFELNRCYHCIEFFCGFCLNECTKCSEQFCSKCRFTIYEGDEHVECLNCYH